MGTEIYFLPKPQRISQNIAARFFAVLRCRTEVIISSAGVTKRRKSADEANAMSGSNIHAAVYRPI